MKKIRSFKIADHVLEDESLPLFLPEIGTFFNSNTDIAIEMIDKLADIGVKIVKGEVLHDVNVALDCDLMENYLSVSGEKKTERYRDLIERKVVPLASYEKIYKHCKAKGMSFVVSVYDRKGAEFAKDLSASALKIASSNIVHEPLVEFVAKLGLPIIIDTGKSTLEEISRAVQWAQDAGNEDIMLQHSPEAKPSPIANHHMNMLKTFRDIYNIPVGLSDHYHGVEMLYVAIALGAHCVEKGVFLDGLESEQDSHHAMPISKVAEVMDKCNQVKLSLGDNMRYLRRDRDKYISRMGIVVGKSVNAGDLLSIENVQFSFPVKGIAVENWNLVENWQFKTKIDVGTPITWSDIEPPSSK